MWLKVTKSHLNDSISFLRNVKHIVSDIYMGFSYDFDEWAGR